MSEIFYQWDLTQTEKESIEESNLDDHLWKIRTGLNEESLCGAIETLIFLSDKPVSINSIKDSIDEELPLRLLHQSLQRLQSEYEQAHHGIRLMEVAEGYQFRTKATYSQFVKDVFKVNAVSLTPLALEVLAMIAYKQPISKTEIEEIRGVDSSHLIRGLMDKRLVKIEGRSDEVGKPALYVTTSEFLEVFNLNSLEDLPAMMELEELARQRTTADISEIKQVVHKPDQKQFHFDDFEELDQLSKSIKSIKTHTDFTKELVGQSTSEKEGLEKEGLEKEEQKSAFEVLEQFLNPAEKQESHEQLSSGQSPDDTQQLFADEQELEGLLDKAFDQFQQSSDKLEQFLEQDKNPD